MPKVSIRENNTSNIHGNFSFEYTEALSRYFSIYCQIHTFTGTQVLFFIVIIFLCIHTY